MGRTAALRCQPPSCPCPPPFLAAAKLYEIGRRLADRLGLRLVGTLGLLLAAKLRGEIPSLRAEIDRLRSGGFRASPALVEEILRPAGEEDQE